jgi:hypothetical protein
MKAETLNSRLSNQVKWTLYLSLALTVLLASLLAATGALAATPGSISLASSNAAGTQGNNNSNFSAISPDGRYVAFTSTATDLVTPATSGSQLFRKDLATGQIMLVSASSAGVQANNNSLYPDLSLDGRYVTFASVATNLVTPATSTVHIFRKDMSTGEVVIVSTNLAGAPGNNVSIYSAVSPDGRYVAISSAATNLVAPATSGQQVFLKDLANGHVTLASASPSGVQGNNTSVYPALSDDGRYVAFSSLATNFVAPVTTTVQVFRKDLSNGQIVLASAAPSGAQANNQSIYTSMSPEGRYIVFTSSGTNLVTPATTGQQVFRKDLATGLVSLVSGDMAGAQGNAGSISSCLSDDARFVSFSSNSTNLVTPATTGQQVFRKDIASGHVDLVSSNSNAAEGNAGSQVTWLSSMSGNGRFIAFDSMATNLVTPATTNQQVYRKQLSVNPNTWYFAEGTCRPGFEPYLTVQNPGPAFAAVTITYMKGDSTTETQTLTVPAHARSTVAVKGVLGEGNDAAFDFSSKVECTNGQQIIAERPMYFNYKPGVLNWNGGSDVMGALAPAPVFYFAEGTCRPGFDPYLTVQNPGMAEADVTITYMKGDGATLDQTLTVPAKTRSTVTVKNTLGEADDAAHDFSCKVSCTNGQRIVAERPMYFNYKPGVLNWNGGSDVVGALSPAPLFYFAEGTCRPGFDPYLTVQNPGAADAAVKITYMKGDGTTVSETLTVPANARSTVVVKNTLGEGNSAASDFSSKVECTNGQRIVAERPMYFNYKPGVLNWNGGSDVVGALNPAAAFYFAEGTARPGFDPYLTVQNPGAASAAVKITYMKGDGATLEQTFNVPAHSRYTVTVKQTLGEGNSEAYDFSSKVQCTNGELIIVERPMYFNYGPGVLNWNGGSDVVGYTP